MNEDLLQLTAEIVTAHVSNNKVGTADLPALIQTTYAALETAKAPPERQAPAQQPAVSIRASVKHDYIVCLEDGKKLQMLKRYLRTNFDLSPDEYRAKWKLPRDYPMVAPAYADRRRTLAHSIGLGRNAKDEVAAAGAAVTAKAQSLAATVSDAAQTAGETLAQPVKAAVKAGRKRLGIAAAKAQAVAHLGGTAASSTPPARTRKPRSTTSA